MIAEIEGVNAGLIVAYLKNIGYFFNHQKIIYIDDVYVVKNYRRLGIARMLIAKIEQIAKENKISRLDSRVYTYNKPMQALLISMGYQSPYATWLKILTDKST